MSADTLDTPAATSVPSPTPVPLPADATEAVFADLWFDPSCPWAWLTSRWLLEVEKIRPVRIRWHVMSLSVLNEDRDMPEQYKQLLASAWGPARLCAAAVDRHGADILRPLYTALGRRRHLDKAEWDERVRASHAEGIGRVGMDVGTPVIAVGETAFFGPVITPAPKGEEAAR
ncbi:DsbA family protein, partial [Frankia sp. CcWB3]